MTWNVSIRGSRTAINDMAGVTTVMFIGGEEAKALVIIAAVGLTWSISVVTDCH